MIDKNEQDPKPKQDSPEPGAVQSRVLRAKDIIPGVERGGTTDEKSGAAKFDIPRFNLAQDILSAQRRQSAVRRKGPEAAEDKGPGFTQGATPRQAEDRRQNIEHRTKNAERPASLKSYAGAGRIETLRDSIIAEIVARDIERLCAGH